MEQPRYDKGKDHTTQQEVKKPMALPEASGL